MLSLFDFVDEPVCPAPVVDDPALDEQAAFLGRDSAGSPSWSMSQTRIMAKLDALCRRGDRARLNDVFFEAYSKAREEKVHHAESV